MNFGLLLLLGVIAAAFLAFFLPDGARIGGAPASELIAQSAYGLVAVALVASLLHRYRGRLGPALRDVLIWAGLTVALVAGYAYRDVFAPFAQRLAAEFSPGAAITTTPGIVEVARRRDGHYLIDMQANGVKVSFVFDTGATSVVLRAEDAGKIGVDVSRLNYNLSVSTANGTARAAEILLDSLAVGTILQRRVRALVARPGALQENLLGMSFLERLASYGVANNRLVLKSE